MTDPKFALQQYRRPELETSPRETSLRAKAQQVQEEKDGWTLGKQGEYHAKRTAPYGHIVVVRKDSKPIAEALKGLWLGIVELRSKIAEIEQRDAAEKASLLTV